MPHYKHQIILTTTDLTTGDQQTRVLKEKVDEDSSPAAKAQWVRPKTPGRSKNAKPVVVRAILESQYRAWRAKHPLAGELKLGQVFESALYADAYVDAMPGRLSTAFSNARALGMKCAQLPKGVVWGYVDDLPVKGEVVV